MARRIHPFSTRRGSAVTELAICLPVMVTLVLGAIETCSLIYLRQGLEAAAYEGVREAIRAQSDNAKALARCEEVLAARRIVDFEVRFDPPDTTLVERGDYVTVEVEASSGANGYMRRWLTQSRDVVAVATMVKE